MKTTDLKKFVDLYESFGAKVKVTPTKEGKTIIFEQGDEDFFNGYPGFGTTIEFDEDGKFIEQRFWNE